MRRAIVAAALVAAACGGGGGGDDDGQDRADAGPQPTGRFALAIAASREVVRIPA
jgi:hypothetical protein